MRALLFVLMSAWLTNCHAAQYEDASNTGVYGGLVGNEYQTLNELFIHGVTYDKNYKNYKKVIDEYVVTNKPGCGGPEVVERKTLKSGSIIKIKKAMRCATCAYSSVKYVTDIKLPQTGSSIPISLTGIGGEKIAIDKGGQLSLNPELFKLHEWPGLLPRLLLRAGEVSSP